MDRPTIVGGGEAKVLHAMLRRSLCLVRWHVPDSSTLATDDVDQFAKCKGCRVLLYRSKNRPWGKI
ncbi:hypothetical protein ADT71_05910 [Novosphingobium sp. ST904]|nr:hypothetical protein ADT71_05910 [Novosphingobium sp. ST904]